MNIYTRRSVFTWANLANALVAKTHLNSTGGRANHRFPMEPFIRSDFLFFLYFKLARVRFLVADDAGAAKTIMAGLLIRELKLRRLAERVLIVCPANLAFQWQRELRDKFEEKFTVLKGDQIREQFGINQWLETSQVITSLDLAKRDNILPGLQQVQ